ALPSRRRAPSPAVALGREPVSRITLHEDLLRHIEPPGEPTRPDQPGDPALRRALSSCANIADGHGKATGTAPALDSRCRGMTLDARRSRYALTRRSSVTARQSIS